MERTIEVSDSEIQSIVLGQFRLIDEELEEETLGIITEGILRSYDFYNLLINKFINKLTNEVIENDLLFLKKKYDEKVQKYFENTNNVTI